MTFEIIDMVDQLPKHAYKTYKTRELDAITATIIHHTVTPGTADFVERIARYHVGTRNWPGIAYHYCIDSSGGIYMTNFWSTVSYHAGWSNTYALGVALLGDFTDAPPPQIQLDAAAWLVSTIRFLLGRHFTLIPHRDAQGAQTECPGDTYTEWIDQLESIGEDEMRLAMWQHSVSTQTIRLNATALLQKEIALDGFQIVGNETIFYWPGFDEMVYQAAERLDGLKPRRVYYVTIPEMGEPWPDPFWFTDPEAAPKPPPPPLPKPSPGMDMAPYFFPETGDFGPIFVISNNWGQGSEKVQLQRESNISYVVKNNQFEQRVVKSDFIDLVLDTSPGDGKYYMSTAHWIPRHWSPGDSFTKDGIVSVYWKSDCQPAHSPYSEHSTMRFAEHYDEWTAPSGIVLQDVVRWIWDSFVTDADEVHYYAKGMGLVRWVKHDGRESHITEILPDHEPDLFREEIPCL
jgi:hypothetical protein